MRMTRYTLARYIEWQLENFEKPGSCHHYGKCELKDLLDFIFGGPPSRPEEGIGYESPEAIEKRTEDRRKELEAAKAAYEERKAKAMAQIRLRGYIE